MPGILDDPTNLDKSKKIAYCACTGRTYLNFVLLPILPSFSLSLGDGSIWTEILPH